MRNTTFEEYDQDWPEYDSKQYFKDNWFLNSWPEEQYNCYRNKILKAKEVDKLKYKIKKLEESLAFNQRHAWYTHQQFIALENQLKENRITPKYY